MEIFKNCLNKQMIDYKNLRLKTYFKIFTFVLQVILHTVIW